MKHHVVVLDLQGMHQTTMLEFLFKLEGSKQSVGHHFIAIIFIYSTLPAGLSVTGG